jgi:hypothetical protein
MQLQIRHNCHIFGLHAQKIQSGMLYTLLSAHASFLVQVGLVCSGWFGLVFLFQYMGPDKSSGPELETLPADKLVYER